MNLEKMKLRGLTIFFTSFFSLALQLFFTRILNLKTWSHVVYIIIPFAILGYGIGANLCLIFRHHFQNAKSQALVGTGLMALSVICVLSTWALIVLPVGLEDLAYLSKNPVSSLASLLWAYVIVMLPFCLIGFLVVYLFSDNPQESAKLYFFDLTGAGVGTMGFFFLISSLGVFRSILLLSFWMFSLGFATFVKRKRIALLLFLLSFFCVLLPEPENYRIDPKKDWEWVPGFFKRSEYETVISKWSALGRVGVFRFKGEGTRNEVYSKNPGTFQINLFPRPEFSYFTNDFLAGSPVYHLSREGMLKNRSVVKRFSQPMEFPYVLLRRPKVFVIGAGGGRDLFVAKTHGAQEVIAAEINPVIHSEMSRGGRLYRYSGKVYDLDGVKVFNVDGRHLAKKLTSGHFDLVILNGVDTFTGLSTGAYCYAESYLYTKEAVMDYLRIVKREGLVNFNRLFIPGLPRETLRLFVIALDALRTSGAKRPWEHIMVGAYESWGMLLIKKTEFKFEEKLAIQQYFKTHNTDLVFPTRAFEKGAPADLAPNEFERYAMALREGNEANFIHSHPFDISVVHDNNPFFFKYYRLRDFHPLVVLSVSFPWSGTHVFLSQFLVLLEALLFILLFIMVPLLIFKKGEMGEAAQNSKGSFVLFFSCLGVGFMFVEIPMIQKFTLLLGDPISSISVSLGALLVSSGLGSSLLGQWQRRIKNKTALVGLGSGLLITFLILFSYGYGGHALVENFLFLPFVARIILTCLMLLPFGLCLGIFFPLGLQVVGQDSKGAIAWAWGINCGSTVLGSILAITIAQFYGFNLVLLTAGFLYLIAGFAFTRMCSSMTRVNQEVLVKSWSN